MDFNLPNCKFLKEARTSFTEDVPRDRLSVWPIGDMGGDDDESARGLTGGEPDPGEDQNGIVLALEGEPSYDSAEFTSLTWSGVWAKKQTRRRQPVPSLHG